MGASTFIDPARRGRYPNGMTVTTEGMHQVHRQAYSDWPDAQTAFDHLADNDRYENGHSYSGGIGMKHDFVHIATVETEKEAIDLAHKLINDCDPRIDDKWGPAGCITVKDGDVQFLFFGWASS